MGQELVHGDILEALSAMERNNLENIAKSCRLLNTSGSRSLPGSGTCGFTPDIMEPKADIALIGLAVMGQNLILNMNDHGFTVVAFNRTVSKVDEFLNKEAKGTNVIGAHSIPEMVGLLKHP